MHIFYLLCYAAVLKIMLTLFHLLISYELMHVNYFAMASHRAFAM